MNSAQPARHRFPFAVYAAIGAFAFLYAPMVALVALSFNQGDSSLV